MTIQMIPLNKLVPSPANVRKTAPLTGIGELAANIKALGLLQNLQVRLADGGTYTVEAGRRRLAALKLLAKRKAIAKTERIACRVLGPDENATEVSLAENFMRMPMHPADQFDAFKALADEGKGPEEIAARFGCSPATIKQRLKLAAVAPALITAYREGEMDLDQLMAFTISDDTEAQLRVWTELADWNRDPSTIRRQLTSAHIEVHDPRVQFVGLKAYRKAGGHVLRDLFEAEHDGYLTDPALLDRLVISKLEKEAKAIRAEGWAWIEIMPEIAHDRLRQMKRVYPEIEPLSPDQQAEIDRLTAAYDALTDEHGDEPSDEIVAELEALSDRIDGLSESTERFRPEDIACSGAAVGIGHGGRLAVERGLVRREDQPRLPHPTSGAEPKPERGLSDQLVENLTAQRTAALRVELARRSDASLTAVVHALALPVFFPHEDAESCLAIRVQSVPLHGSATGIEDSEAGKALDELEASWRRALPSEPAALWDWLLRQDLVVRLDLLAFCAGCAVNAVKKKADRADNDRLGHADLLAAQIGLDMAAWWQPTADRYLRHVPKLRILEAVREAVTPGAADNLATMKKDGLIMEAERRLAGTGWLPPILRAPMPPASAEEPFAIAAE
ncbi:MAG: ParB/RepB/Spo0J family partition protein [Alphaproteobacteria bacterium]|nr:ParB/RepB/Spo0J family partition protein [Alphaproteobacteria bacterium]